MQDRSYVDSRTDKEIIMNMLAEAEIEFRHTTEGNIVSREVLFFFGMGEKLIDVGNNNLPEYKDWEI
jgi:hypothetical protein